jgi:hypothetical protein
LGAVAIAATAPFSLTAGQKNDIITGETSVQEDRNGRGKKTKPEKQFRLYAE